MVLEFENSEEDYSKSSSELVKKYFWKTILYYSLISLVLASVFTSIDNSKFYWSEFILIFVILLVIITITNTLRSFYNSKKVNKSIKKDLALYIDKKRIITEPDGFFYGSKNIKYEWSSVNKIEDLPSYIFLILHNKTSIIISKKGLQNSEIDNFVSEVSENIIYKKSFFGKISSKTLYKLGFIGLIPNFGLLSGTILIVQGFIRKDNKMKLIGLAGILFTPVFWYFFLTSDFQKNNLTQFTNIQLNEVVKDLEFYKSKNGQYPDSLTQLKPQNKFFNDQELFSNEFDFKKSKPSRFYYKKTDNDYVLKSFGPDLILNTKDDIYPELKTKK